MSWSVRHHRLLGGLLIGRAFAATAARALRGPNDFALAHWMPDWRLGSLNRGLPGSELALCGRAATDLLQPALAAVVLKTKLPMALLAFLPALRRNGGWALDLD